jgi:uncharacterized phage protein (TIGR01671 family)
MSREIKFRAWDGKGMLGMPLDGMYGLERFFGFLSANMERGNVHSYKLMQYTGLKDKNGLEIYEGDIVAIPYVTPIGQVTDDVDTKRVVEFANGCFGVWGKRSFLTLQGFLKHSDGEYIPNCGNKVIYGECMLKKIGTIYENPELVS